MEIIKKGISLESALDIEYSNYNAVYNASCSDIGCTCDDCVDGG